MPNKLPPPAERLKKDYAEVWKAFTQLGSRCHEAGPLDVKARRLVKVALALAAGLEGATHSAVRAALAEGLAPAEIRHVAVLAITTLGLPTAERAMTWIGDVIEPAAAD